MLLESMGIQPFDESEEEGQPDPFAHHQQRNDKGHFQPVAQPKTYVSIRLRPALLTLIDAYAETHGTTRTEAIERLITQALGKVNES